MEDAEYNYTDEELLYNARSLIENPYGEGYAFTNAGFLFFASNPQRVLNSAEIRLLRYPTDHDKLLNPGATTYDKFFTGSIIKQVTDARNFFKSSGFFKLYEKRNGNGYGFIDEPEYPTLAIDEAIVNAIAHRDYQINLPIVCEYYTDAFIVKSPGGILQKDKDVPEKFTLKDISLSHTSRNDRLVRWLKMMKTPDGKPFMRALSEGTRKMTHEMEAIGLPAPQYKNNHAETTLILFSDAARREAEIQGLPHQTSPQKQARKQWTGSEIKQINQAFLSAYSELQLKRFLVFELETNLDDITSNNNFNEIVFELIEWARSEGRLEELIEKAKADKPENEAIQAIP